MNQVSAFQSALVFGHDLFLDNISLHIDDFSFDAGEVFHERSQCFIHTAGDGINNDLAFLFRQLIELFCGLGTVIDVRGFPGFIRVDCRDGNHADKHCQNNQYKQF